MFGLTHVVAIDGYSGKIVRHSTMAIQNNIIYEEVYRCISQCFHSFSNHWYYMSYGFIVTFLNSGKQCSIIVYGINLGQTVEPSLT